MVQKSVDIIQSSIAFLVFISIIGVSTLSVIALNPKEGVVLNTQASGNVAGMGKNIYEATAKSNKSILINNLSKSTEEYKTSFLYNSEKKEYNFSVNFLPLSLNMNEKFIEVFNNSQNESYLDLSLTLEGYIQEDLTIRLNDGTDTFTIYDPSLRNTNFRIKLPPSSRKIFKIEYSFATKVNFPIGIKIVLN